MNFGPTGFGFECKITTDSGRVLNKALWTFSLDFQFVDVVHVALAIDKELILDQILTFLAHVWLDWTVYKMLVEVVSKHLSISIFGLQVVWHWNPAHLSASFKHTVAKLIHKIAELVRIRHHKWKEPVASILNGLPWDKVTHS